MIISVWKSIILLDFAKISVSFLTKTVLNLQLDNWSKLKRAIQYLRKISHVGMVLETAEIVGILAYIDASYGVHEDFRNYTWCVIGIGRGPVYAKSTGQKLNTKSSTEAELVALSDPISQVIWTRYFLEEQGFVMGPPVIYQDNMSTIKLVINGKSNSDRTKYITI